MKKILLTILTVFLIIPAFILNVNAETKKDTKVFNVPKTSTVPKLDGDIDACYKQIFSMKGSDCLDSKGKTTDSFPVGFNRTSLRYDAIDHPNKEDADWWKCSIAGYAAYDDNYLYLLVDIKNAGHLDNNPDANWVGDCIQLSVFKGTAESGDTTEYIIAQNNGNITVSNPLNNTLSAIARKKYAYNTNRLPSGHIKISDGEIGNYTYELALEWEALGIKPTDNVNFNCSINLNDSNMDEAGFCGFQLSPGIFNERDQKTKSGMAYASSMIFVGAEPETPPKNNEASAKETTTEVPKIDDNPAQDSDPNGTAGLKDNTADKPVKDDEKTSAAPTTSTTDEADMAPEPPEGNDKPADDNKKDDDKGIKGNTLSFGVTVVIIIVFCCGILAIPVVVGILNGGIYKIKDFFMGRFKK